MSGNSFTRISAGTNTPPFKLSGGRYVVTAQPGPTAPGQWGGLCSLQVQQGSSFADVGASTNFQKPRSVALHLAAGTYRFSAIISATLIASVKPAT
ncbi:MAG: hypothetical protein P4M05_06495 [Bradyrhizobium sp.]|nr:hypothetical protein [Bradyrhizobium sp.]